MFLKMQLTQNICVLDSVPTVCFPVLPLFCLVLFKKLKIQYNNIMEKKFAKSGEKITHSATFLTNTAISTPAILLSSSLRA